MGMALCVCMFCIWMLLEMVIYQINHEQKDE